MRLLVDSCVLVWWLDNPASLAKEAREAIADPSNEVYFSAASVWELGLKIRKGKLTMPIDFASALSADGFSSLSVTVDHAARSLSLPALHEDPFDRLLVAQAIAEGLVMVTRDEVIRDYPLAVMRA
jgi:PIN domain nuclease of toxin-antitoxin system